MKNCSDFNRLKIIQVPNSMLSTRHTLSCSIRNFPGNRLRMEPEYIVVDIMLWWLQDSNYEKKIFCGLGIASGYQICSTNHVDSSRIPESSIQTEIACIFIVSNAWCSFIVHCVHIWPYGNTINPNYSLSAHRIHRRCVYTRIPYMYGFHTMMMMHTMNVATI